MNSEAGRNAEGPRPLVPRPALIPLRHLVGFVGGGGMAVGFVVLAFFVGRITKPDPVTDPLPAYNAVASSASIIGAQLLPDGLLDANPQVNAVTADPDGSHVVFYTLRISGSPASLWKVPVTASGTPLQPVQMSAGEADVRQP